MIKQITIAVHMGGLDFTPEKGPLFFLENKNYQEKKRKKMLKYEISLILETLHFHSVFYLH